MNDEIHPMSREDIEEVRRAPGGTVERALLATLDQRDRGISDLTLAIHAERREKQRLQETIDAERQWYPFDRDQEVHVCAMEVEGGARWAAVFADKSDAESWAHAVSEDEDDGRVYDVKSGRMAGLKLWNSFEPMPRQTLPDDVVRALRVAALLPCMHYPHTFGVQGMFGPDETCVKACTTCVARRAARAGLKAAEIEVTP